MSLVMDTSKFKPESHVAQQSRREKLRVHHFEDFPNSLEQDSSVHSGLNSDLVQVRNLRNAKMLHEPTIVYSGIIRVPPQENASAKVSGDPPSCGNLMVGYASGLGGRENNQNPMFIGEVLSNNARESNVCAAMQYFGTGSDICRQDSKRHCGELQFVSSSLYDVATASVGTQASALHFDNAGAWTNRPLLEHCPQWGETSSTIQGLSLALSSNPSSKIYGAAQFTEDQRGSQHAFKEPHRDSKALKPGHLFSMQKPSIIGKSSGNSTYVHPLGPFTGYATILKNSRFLKPAQELLGQYCHMTNSKLGKVHETSDGVSNSIGVSASVAVANAVDMEDGAIKGNNSGASVSGLCSSNEISTVDVSVGGSSEYQQKKAKLLYLQDEVCRRYKLYYQQMQMVVSSFESVDCLSVATSYISLALKTVERNFRCLRNAISDRVRMKYGVQKSGGVNTGFLEPQQEGWRPQRGLPERAVAILRAWLFEHFLHPYPTDTDKHMLANRTGLARNQVSNWFINARVRVWKPMVEEIHMLESKGLEASNQNSIKTDTKSTTAITIRPNEEQSINSSCINTTSDKQLACSNMAIAGITEGAYDAERRYHEKHSSMDFRISSSMDGSLISFTPHDQSRLETGGLGAVSLTLGLKHGVESAEVFQHQLQYQPHEYQLRGKFGGRMIHEFVG
ncbi:BEL1-like homeodomain protein 8 isoform X2 [Hibiscus syriacus]|uniref:BEL1-like homeodomain protein 8 isoform X2 n=1 Tax=Hibiscus syriacus TaxID=106335 RepID=UPI001922A207|nr:BEL1-like homeodomain protein 8 isoform X2 [Hibiscus syriacus]